MAGRIQLQDFWGERIQYAAADGALGPAAWTAGVLLGARAFGERTGIYAALFVYTCAGVFLFTRILIPEVLLSLLIAASLYFFLTALEPGAAAWRWYAGYALMALGVLTKGLIALVFPCGAAFFFLLVTGEWRRWREFRLISGLALFLAIAAPWHILAGLRNPGTAEHHGFFWFYFVNEHFLRFLGKRYPRDYNKLPATLYWTLHLVWLFPWSLYLPAALTIAWQEWRGRRGSLGTSGRGATQRMILPRGRGCCAGFWREWCWSFLPSRPTRSTTRSPRICRFCCCWRMGLRGASGRSVRAGKRAGWLTASAGVLAVLELSRARCLVVGLWQSRNLPFEPDIGRLLSKQDMSAYTLSMSHMLDLSYASFAALRLPAALAAVVLLLAPPAVFPFARLPAALFRDVGAGGGIGSIFGGGAYCSGTIWAVSFFEAIGAGDCGAGAAGR